MKERSHENPHTRLLQSLGAREIADTPVTIEDMFIGLTKGEASQTISSEESTKKEEGKKTQAG